MRTNIVIDDRLMRQAQRASGAATKKEAVERGLRLLLTQGTHENHAAHRAFLRLFGELDSSTVATTRRSSDPLKAALDAKYRG